MNKPIKLVNDILTSGELFEFHGSRAADATGRILGGEFLMFSYTRPICGMQSVILFAMFHVIQHHAMYGVEVNSTAYATGIDSALRSLEMLDQILHDAVANRKRRAIMRACTYRDDVKKDEQLVEEINRELHSDKRLVAPHLRSNPSHPIHSHNPFFADLIGSDAINIRDGAFVESDDEDEDDYDDEHDDLTDDELDNCEVPTHDAAEQLSADMFEQRDVAMIETCQDILQDYYRDDPMRLIDLLGVMAIVRPTADGSFDMNELQRHFCQSREIRRTLSQDDGDTDDATDDSDDSDHDDTDEPDGTAMDA